MVQRTAGGHANAGSGNAQGLGEVSEQADFAEIAARADIIQDLLDALPGLADFDEPGADHVEMVGHITLADDDLARMNANQPHLRPQEIDKAMEFRRVGDQARRKSSRSAGAFPKCGGGRLRRALYARPRSAAACTARCGGSPARCNLPGRSPWPSAGTDSCRSFRRRARRSDPARPPGRRAAREIGASTGINGWRSSLPGSRLPRPTAKRLKKLKMPPFCFSTSLMGDLMRTSKRPFSMMKAVEPYSPSRQIVSPCLEMPPHDGIAVPAEKRQGNARKQRVLGQLFRTDGFTFHRKPLADNRPVGEGPRGAGNHALAASRHNSNFPSDRQDRRRCAPCNPCPCAPEPRWRGFHCSRECSGRKECRRCGRR